MTTLARPPVTSVRAPDHVTVVTIDRPEARNAINAAVAKALGAIVAATENDPDVWAVVLTGSGSTAFCAGADLKAVSNGEMASLYTESGGFAGLVKAKRTKPWIAAVEGLALAGGCEIALACDFIVASQDSAFGLPEVSRGLIAAAGGLFRLPRAIPPRIAAELIVTAERLSAERAAAFGMVNRLVPPGRAVEEALKLAAAINRNAPLAVRESLAIVKAFANFDEDELQTLSLLAQDRLASTLDFAEGPLAFIEKRAPRWVGR